MRTNIIIIRVKDARVSWKGFSVKQNYSGIRGIKTVNILRNIVD
jgi:hypothetical protein